MRIPEAPQEGVRDTYPQEGVRSTYPQEGVRSTYVVGVSAGTAGVIGLHPIRQADVPTTAYLMVGERCSYDCAFCTQAHSSAARAHFLSRVAWPPYSVEDTLRAIQQSFAQREIVRCCLQVTVFPGYLPQTLALVQEIHSLSAIPICVSITVPHLDGVRALLEQGAERVSLALDAACERAYRGAKGDDWSRRLALLYEAAGLFPGRIGTHLVVGLGETEQEMATTIQDMVDRQVTIGLFAFTPVAGTNWEDRPPPLLPSYRRIQAARHLLTMGACRVESFHFSATGQILSYGLHPTQLQELLADGRAFQTAGCPGCNRPYYNERPGKAMYNYPRPLRPAEIEAAICAVVAELACG